MAQVDQSLLTDAMPTIVLCSTRASLRQLVPGCPWCSSYCYIALLHLEETQGYLLRRQEARLPCLSVFLADEAACCAYNTTIVHLRIH